MERSRVGHFPPRRRRSVVRATVWPWQTGPTVPQGPPATRNSVENRTSPTKKRLVSSLPSSSATAISTSLAPLSGSSEGAFVVGNERDNGACDFVESRTGALVEDVNTPESGVGGGGRNISGPIVATHEGGYSELVPSEGIPEGWPFITSQEKRRMWLKRRRMGQFYFRTEFRGLVYQVMRSRGWKQACRPRVSDEEQVDMQEASWDEQGLALKEIPETGLERPEAESWQAETSGSCSPLDCKEWTGEESNGNKVSTGGDIIAAVEEPDPKDGELVREKQWDVHWSYTKWAVETMRFARNLAPWQKVNHFRNSKELCRKDLMLKNLKKRRALLVSQGELTEAQSYHFFPVSFELSKDYALFAEEFREAGGTWIMKPSGSAEGRGIFLFSKLADVKAWAKPQLCRDMLRSDPANPGSFVVQRYVSNPFLVGGKKFDLRLYLLVTSFRPLTAYIYRDGFAKFSSKRFSADLEHLKNELMHLTNHAVQRRGAASGKKWKLKKFKLYVAMQYGQKAMDKLFWEIEALMVRTLRAVDRLVINDQQSFELFGYDVMVDENLRPWLLEVNASPSLGASNREDLRLKKQMIGDLFDILDVEGRWQKCAPVREHLGGFDLVYHNGHVELPPSECGHSTFLGAVTRNPVRHNRRRKPDKDKYSVFPLPASVMSASNGRTDEDSQSDVQAGKSIPGVVDHTSDTSWRPNFFTVRPEDRWKGLVDQFDQSPSLQNHENIGYGGQHSRDGRDTTTMCLPDKPSIEKENVAFSQSAQNIQGECCQPGERDKGAICEPAEGHAIWRGGDTGERSPSTAAEVAALVGNTLVCDSTNKMPNFAIRNKDEASFSEKTRRELRQLGAVAVEFPKGNVGHMKQSTEEGSWLEPGKVEAVLENLADRLRQIRKARLASEKHE